MFKEELGGGTLEGNAGSLNAFGSSLEPVVTPPFKSVLARLPLCVTCQVAKGVIFFIEGEDYSLKFTD